MEINEWREAIIDGLVTAHNYRQEHESDPRKALHDLIRWEVSVALDPLVSKAASELVERGRREGMERAVEFCQAQQEVQAIHGNILVAEGCRFCAESICAEIEAKP